MSDTPPDRRVLLVEDEMLVARMLEGMITALGYTLVASASRLDEAMEFLKGEVFDVVVLDINLDGQMSFPIADALLARNIPFVFSTGYETGDLPAKYEDALLLKKPYRRSALADALRELLRRQVDSPWATADGEDRSGEDSGERQTG